MKYKDIDLDAYLAERGQIAICWSIEDVQESRPDLTEQQAWEVLEAARDGHNAEVGMCWDALDMFATDLFGHAPAAADTEEE